MPVVVHVGAADAVRLFARDVGRTMVQQQIPFATALALTRTARAALVDEQDEMRRVFDRPRKYTLNSMRVVPATKQNLVAVLATKDGNSRQRPASKYLLAQAVGGARGNKALETKLEAAGKGPLHRTLVPTKAARRDGEGNIPRRQIGAGLRGMERRGKGTGRSGFFMARPGNKQKLTPGLYQRMGRYPKGGEGENAGQGKRRAIFLFHDNPHYRTRFKFQDVGRDSATARFPDIFESALRQAISTGRR